MEIASALITITANTLRLLYGIVLFKNLYDRLKGGFPNETNIKWQIHISFACVILIGFAMVIGKQSIISWLIWVGIFVLDIFEFKYIIR